ncbi:hypothetical protein Zm00014a_033081 [Zea mays]|uniref:Uncharacterized protein n=1 Tax=Zea mays TaxID=4577 RepID=A0A3L6FBP5_MAIZE|nr:hypothetical protein Zm00014a_033081 [Zea mays]
MFILSLQFSLGTRTLTKLFGY